MDESRRYPGYFHIPGFRLYVVNKDGDIIQCVTGHHIGYRRNTSGYYVCSLISDSQKRMQVSRSRVICTTFKPIDGAQFLQIDHVNCNKGDDRLENLEWVTGKENCRRAARNGLYKGAHPVKVKEFRTGKVVTYPSMMEAGRAYGLNKNQIMYRLESNDGRVYPEGNQYKFVEDMTNWAEKEDASFDTDAFGTSKKTLVRDLTTGEVSEFDRITDAATAIGVAVSNLSCRLSNEIHPIFRGLKQAKLKYDGRDWREPEDALMELCGDASTAPVVAIRASDGFKTIYLKQTECARQHRLRTNTLNYRLKYGKPSTIYSDGYMYRYYSSKEDGSTTSTNVRRVL